MDAKTASTVAVACQNLARFLAPYQNAADVRLAPRAWYKRLLWRMFPPRPADLPERAVTDIVNALLNAGNTLGHLARTKPEMFDAPDREPLNAPVVQASATSGGA